MRELRESKTEAGTEKEGGRERDCREIKADPGLTM